MTGLLVGVALAAAPDADLRPILAPWDAPDKWAAYLAAKGAAPDPLACQALVDEHVRVCLRVREGERLRWVTQSDLATWAVTHADALAIVKERAATHLSTAEEQEVGGMTARYLRLVDGEGWAAAMALWPGQVAHALGPDARFAFPAGTVALAWAAGDAAFDKVMAVGVVELAEEQPGAVSRTVFRWDGEAFTPFAEARPTDTPADAPQKQQNPATK